MADYASAIRPTDLKPKMSRKANVSLGVGYRGFPPQNLRANSRANTNTISSAATIGKFPSASRCNPQNLI
jgi:hypothetical protein